MDIVWLRDDFRLDDQPAIAAAAGRPALFVYVHDETPCNGRPSGGAARWRLARSLTAMERGLAARGARLDVLEGGAGRTILALAAAAKAERIFWTRRYEGDAIALDGRVKAALRERGAEALSFAGRLLREPWELARTDGKPPGVFSAFWRRHRGLGPVPAPTPAPERLVSAPWPTDAPSRVAIDALRLAPTKPDWSAELALGETLGEAGALEALGGFLRTGSQATRTSGTGLRARRRRGSQRICALARFRRAGPPAPPTAPRRPIPDCRDLRKNSSPSSAGAISPPRSSTPIPIWRRGR